MCSLTSHRYTFCSTPDTCGQTHTSYFCSLWMVSMNHFSRYLSGGEELYLVTDTVCSRGTFFIVKRGIVFCFSFVILMFFSTWKSRFLERGYWLMVEFNHLYYFPPTLFLFSLPCSSGRHSTHSLFYTRQVLDFGTVSSLPATILYLEIVYII